MPNPVIARRFLPKQSPNKTAGDCFVVQKASRNDSIGGFCGQTLIRNSLVLIQKTFSLLLLGYFNAGACDAELVDVVLTSFIIRNYS